MGCRGVRSGLKYARVLASSRRVNEDRVECLEHGEDLVVVVADGAGGLLGGDSASETFIAAVKSATTDAAFDVREGACWSRLLAEVDMRLNRAMAGETTAVVVVVTPEGLVGVSAGDSQAWVVGAADIDDLTGAQARKRLGTGCAARVGFSRPSLTGTLVVGTDGVFNYLNATSVARAVRWREPADAAERLRAALEFPSSRYADDVGIAIVSTSL